VDFLQDLIRLNHAFDDQVSVGIGYVSHSVDLHIEFISLANEVSQLLQRSGGIMVKQLVLLSLFFGL